MENTYQFIGKYKHHEEKKVDIENNQIELLEIKKQTTPEKIISLSRFNITDENGKWKNHFGKQVKNLLKIKLSPPTDITRMSETNTYF